ncbi:MAG TPA: HEAT repeat domain-containing protein, partial [Pyrinomonadaceae bacterium]|nr:HEAT repeat domain-containing protein [Pyrinomonadaceae bacterium]
MSSSSKSQNPAVRAILDGTAPPQARMAAASGMLPLPQSDLLEVLVNLRQEDDPNIVEAATETLAEQDAEDLLAAATNDDTSPTVLDYLATLSDEHKQIHEAVILNRNT